MTYNTDFGDSWEREGESHEYFLTFSVEAYAFGTNAIVYAMTHRRTCAKKPSRTGDSRESGVFA